MVNPEYHPTEPECSSNSAGVDGLLGEEVRCERQNPSDEDNPVFRDATGLVYIKSLWFEDHWPVC